jgi:hypothetical protein
VNGLGRRRFYGTFIFIIRIILVFFRVFIGFGRLILWFIGFCEVYRLIFLVISFTFLEDGFGCLYGLLCLRVIFIYLKMWSPFFGFLRSLMSCQILLGLISPYYYSTFLPDSFATLNFSTLQLASFSLPLMPNYSFLIPNSNSSNFPFLYQQPYSYSTA